MSKSQVDMSFFSERSVKATYVGGHKAFPKTTHTEVAIYHDRLELMKPSLQIPYSSMTKIENMEEKKISALRVVALGVVGAIWKKKMIYTVIEYNDGLDDNMIILDFGKKLNEVQPLIYQKMVLARDLHVQ